jgi:3-methylcrotonyl-CoA carboxylase alpha subunit
MSQALSEYEIVGPATNIAFLSRLMQSKPFATADLDTGLIERHQDSLFPPHQPVPFTVLALACAMLHHDERDHSSDDPWAQHHGWRMNLQTTRPLQFSDEAGMIELAWTYASDHGILSSSDKRIKISDVHAKTHEQDDAVEFDLVADNIKVHGKVVRVAENFHVFHAGQHWQLTWHDPIAHAGEAELEGGRLTAPMPGKIIALLVKKDELVQQGAPLLIMEAMKMEHTIHAPSNGKVEDLLYAVGDQVPEGAQLLAFTATGA